MADYNVMDKATVGQVKTGLARVKADYEGKILPAFKSAKAEGNTVNFYTSTDQTGEVAFSFDFPAELFLDQAKTVFVPEFTFSAETYPGAEDPNLNGKPVMVLAVKGENDSATYSFLDMAKLVDTYTAEAGDGSTTVTVNGYKISVNVNISEKEDNALQKDENGKLYVPKTDTTDKADKVASATEGNLAGLDAEGNLTDSGVAAANVATKVAGATEGNLPMLDASGNIVDSGVPAVKVLTEENVATDEEFNAMLDELFPAE